MPPKVEEDEVVEDFDDVIEVDDTVNASDDEYDDEEIDIIENRIEPETSLKKYKKVVARDQRRTSNRLSLFECARVLGDRARHISNGAPIYVDDKDCRGEIEIAYLELVAKRIPMSVIRKVGLDYVEIWDLNEMIIPQIPTIDYFTRP